MNISRQNNSRSGIALIVVMIAIAVFSILVAAFAFSMKVETKLAQKADNEQQLLWLGRSGDGSSGKTKSPFGSDASCVKIQRANSTPERPSQSNCCSLSAFCVEF